MATDALYAQSEVVSKSFPEFFGTAPVLVNKLKKNGKLERISERDFRAPFLTQNGGRTGTFNSNGGAIGRGTASKGNVFTQTFYSFRIAYELPQLMIDATSDPQISRLNAFKKAIKSAIPEMANFVDQAFHSDGTAIIATSVSQSTVSSKTVYVMDTVTACRKLRLGQYVIPYNSGGSALNSGTAVQIDMIDYANRAVTLSATIGSAAGGDTLCWDGVTGASPTGPQGLKYFNNSSTSGSRLGVSAATTYEVVSNSVPVAGVPTFMSGQKLLDQVIERRKGIVKGMMWVSSEKQKSNLRSQVLTMSRFDLTGNGKGLGTDLNDEPESPTFDYCGRPGVVDPHQDNDRMDLINFSDWTRCQVKDLGYYEQNGNRFFTIYGADGSPAATTWFALYLLENYVCENPGNAGYLSGLTLPTY